MLRGLNANGANLCDDINDDIYLSSADQTRFVKVENECRCVMEQFNDILSQKNNSMSFSGDMDLL
jgi:hypothetical protein